MPLQIIREDITRFPCDAIVNAAKNSLLGGGGVDGAIHKAAGPGLLEECRTLGGCETGQAKITKAYNLPCKYVIHTVGPVWRGGFFREKQLLASCYHQSLSLAKANGCETVAFPLISAGVYGYPKDKAMRTAVDAISTFLLEHDDDMTVYLLVFSPSSYLLSKQLFKDVRAFIDDHYVDTHYDACSERMRMQQMQQQWGGHFNTSAGSAENEDYFYESTSFAAAPKSGIMPSRAVKDLRPQSPARVRAETSSLEDMLAHIDESFSQMLLRKIDERGMTDAECYKKANIDRKLFSKIRSDMYYKPSKQTAIAFAIALELPLEETRELLMKAGFAFSPASKFDLIIEYFIRKKNYNIFEINEALFAFDQNLLGA